LCSIAGAQTRRERRTKPPVPCFECPPALRWHAQHASSAVSFGFRSRRLMGSAPSTRCWRPNRKVEHSAWAPPRVDRMKLLHQQTTARVLSAAVCMSLFFEGQLGAGVLAVEELAPMRRVAVSSCHFGRADAHGGHSTLPTTHTLPGNQEERETLLRWLEVRSFSAAPNNAGADGGDVGSPFGERRRQLLAALLRASARTTAADAAG